MANTTMFYTECGESAFNKEIGKVIDLFMDKYPNNVIVPCQKKHSKYPHKNNSFTWETYKEKKITFEKDDMVGVLLKDLIVIDIDEQYVIKEWEEDFPILKETVSEDTKKGRHYFFKRTPLCDELKIFDKSRGIKIDGKSVPVDIKTICSTGTAGVIIIAPSKDKKWFNSIYDDDIKDIPTSIIKFISNNWTEKKKRKEKVELIDVINKEIDNLNINEDDNEKDVENLVEILNPERVNNYSDWISLGWCLYNISKETNKNYLKVWDTISKKSNKYIENETMNLWNKMEYKPNGYKMGTLRMWAKEDNPEIYNSIYQKKLRFLLITALSKTDKDFADVFKFIYPENFVSIVNNTGKSSLWYYFNGICWMKGGINYIRDFLITTIIGEFENLFNEVNEEVKNCEDTDVQESKKEFLIEIKKALDCLKFSTKIANIEKMLSCMYADKNNEFMEKLDSNKMLLGFKDGVYDFVKKEFRPARPDDYISTQMGINFPKKVNEVVRGKVLNHLNEVLGSEENTKYLLKTLGYASTGNKNREVMYFWRGPQRGGKGTLAKLLEILYGGYFLSPKPDIVTCSKNKSGSAQSEVANFNHKRLIVMSEPNDKQELQVQELKRYIGNDLIDARDLYETCKPFVPQFVMFMLCNEEPILSAYEPDFILKLEILRFPYQFKINPDPYNPIEKPINKDIKIEFETDIRFAEQLMLLILENYEGGDYTIPESVKKECKEFMDNNNTIGNWLEENYNIVSKNGKGAKVLRSDLWSDAQSAKLGVTRNQFYKEMESKNKFEPKKNNGYIYYYGIQRKGQECAFKESSDI
jgi:phage/plasmid-associated DNA primase